MILCALALHATACRRRAPAAPAPDAGALTALTLLPTLGPASDDGSAPAVPPPAPETWCVRALPHADARAVDPRGHVVALRDFTVRDESAPDARPVALPRANPPCTVRRDHLAFAADGSAAAVAHGRIYLRAANASAWTETPFCTDVGGEPWSPRATSRGPGWTVVGRRFRESEAALLVTDDPAGLVGWNARRGFRADTRAIVLEGDGSHLGLTAAGDVWFVDTAREVAGGLLAALGAQFTSATRTTVGTALARDADASHREIVTGTTVRVPFRRRLYSRPAGPRTHAVFAWLSEQLVAVTDQGVEWSAGNGTPFVSVARWPAPLETTSDSDAATAADPAASTSFGSLPDGSPLVVNAGALATTDCNFSALPSLDASTIMRR